MKHMLTALYLQDSGEASTQEKFDTVKGFFRNEVEINVFEESETYLHFLIPKTKEKRLCKILKDVQVTDIFFLVVKPVSHPHNLEQKCCVF